MNWKRMVNYFRYPLLVAAAVFVLAGAEHRGVVKFGTVPVPGATVTATQGEKKLVVITGQDGAYAFPELADGVWSIQVEMLCFAPLQREIGVSAEAPAAEWELKMLPMDQIKPETAVPPAAPATSNEPATPAAAAQPAAAPPPVKGGKPSKNTKGSATGRAAGPQPGFQRAAVNATGDATPGDSGTSLAGAASSSDSSSNGGASDALLVNGSVSTGIEQRAIGNFRVGSGSLFNGGLSFIVDNSALDARTYSITGQDTPKQSFNHLTPGISFGGPLMIPHLFRYNGNFFIGYQASRNRNANTQSSLMPTAAERAGDFSQVLNSQGQPVAIYDPQSADPRSADPTKLVPFPNNQIPASRLSLSPQAQALLAYYPQPNNPANSRYNYQIPLVGRSDSDGGQARVNKNINSKNFLSFSFAIQNSRTISPNLFAFVDQSNTTGLNGSVNWRHTFSRQWFGTFGFTFSRSVVRSTPYFANLVNVSGKAGITGNDQTPNNWGPPGLSFTSGIAALSDGQQSMSRNQTGAASASITWLHRPHNVTLGGDFRLLQSNPVSQSNARGSFSFTGAATQQVVNGVAVPGTGSDFADFLLGIPDLSSVAFGNADKYFRGTSSDLFFTDDWRVSSTFTLNAGMRWEYNSPLIEKFGRLVNLDFGPGFSSPMPVVANNPVGPVSGLHYPDSLVRPDKRGIEPRISFAWHPFFGTSTIFRGGYGVYYDTSVYQNLVSQMAQQSPLSKSLSVQNSPADPLTLANGFQASPSVTANTFALDPNFRPGYSQNWQFSVQQNLTASMVLTATYLGTKGTHAVQAFLPNTYPAGVANPCAACLAGYTFVTSNGNSTRESGQLSVRRRFHSGFSTSFLYTYSKAIDDAALGGRGQGTSVIAQDWQHLNEERGLSNFDQRHQLQVQMQYSTGVGVHGGTLLGGWRGTIIKGWTIVSQINLGTGLPETPIYYAAVGNTGSAGSTRPEYDGQPIYDAANGAHFNVNAFTAPPNGLWGNAGRNSLTGPGQFSMTASMARSFEKFDLRFDSKNPINHVSYPSWNAMVLSGQFGLPSAANDMRSISATLRWRFP